LVLIILLRNKNNIGYEHLTQKKKPVKKVVKKSGKKVVKKSGKKVVRTPVKKVVKKTSTKSSSGNVVSIPINSNYLAEPS